MLQFGAIGLAMLRLADTWGPLYLDEWLMLAAVAVTIISAWDYFRRYGSALQGRSAGATDLGDQR